MTCGKPSCRLRSMENDLKLIEMNEICFRENYISLKEKSDGFRKVLNHSRGDAIGRERDLSYLFHGINSFLASRTFIWVRGLFSIGLSRCRCILKTFECHSIEMSLDKMTTNNKSLWYMFDFR